MLIVRPSISRFFKRKASPAPLREKVNGNAHVIEVVDDEEDFAIVTGPGPVKKSKTSGYFGSVSSASRDNESNGTTPTTDERPVAGPSRKPSASRAPTTAPTYLQDYRLPRSSPMLTAEETGAFGTFSYPSSSQARPPTQRTAAQQEQHEKWHRKVVGGNLIARRRSLALDEAAAAEARRLITGAEPEEPDGMETPPVEATQDSDDERQKQAEQVGNGLAAKYGAKMDVKGKGKGTSRKKKEEEVGPSGQTYTPLERQYMEIHAKNPDVLLLMEGESRSGRYVTLLTDGQSDTSTSTSSRRVKMLELMRRFHGEDAKVSGGKWITREGHVGSPADRVKRTRNSGVSASCAQRGVDE